jgi:deoxyribodipyrimidine photo-lyase
VNTVIFWFRSDLRLHDQRALQAACKGSTRHLLPVLCLPDVNQITEWGFPRIGPHRRAWWASAVRSLRQDLSRLGCPLLICTDPATTALPLLARAVSAQKIVCEEIAAPEEEQEVVDLSAAGLTVQKVWHSSLLDPGHLPWPVEKLPRVFTTFRHAIERADITPDSPLRARGVLPPWPHAAPKESPQAQDDVLAAFAGPPRTAETRSAFPYFTSALHGGETAAADHLTQYFRRGLAVQYKQTRNALMGLDYSSKWSPWLATGALSPRQAMAQLRQFESQYGASEGSYWLWFEFLWRDYFRFLHMQHGRALYGAHGLGPARAISHQAGKFEAWCAGKTGQPLVDAGMRELAATGYLSNRLRQVAASYLVYDLACDWRAGAAWFESQLLDGRRQSACPA